MKKVFAFLFFSMMVVSCSSRFEVWDFELGDSRKNIVHILEEKGFNVEDDDDSYIYVNQKFHFRGIDWSGITCWFDKKNQLKGIEFCTWQKLSDYQLEKLYGYFEEEGFGEPYSDPRCNEIVMREKDDMTAVITFSKYGHGLITSIELGYWKNYHKSEK